MKKIHLPLSLLLLCLSLLASNTLKAQDSTRKQLPNYDYVSMGLGFGQTYGGIGANLLAYPQKYIGLTAGVGYAITGLGYNAGLKLRYFSPKRAVPRSIFFMTWMYGYTLAIKVKNLERMNKMFYGHTVGLGFDTQFDRRKRVGYWSFALLLPIRGTEESDYIDNLKNRGVTINDPWPVTFSVGYRIVMY